MPTSEKQRRAVFAELNHRMAGGKPKMFTGMSNQKLTEYAHSPLDKKKKKDPLGGGLKFPKFPKFHGLHA